MAEPSSSNASQNDSRDDGYYYPDRYSNWECRKDRCKPKPPHHKGKDGYYDGVFIKKKCDCRCLTDWSKVLKCGQAEINNNPQSYNAPPS